MVQLRSLLLVRWLSKFMQIDFLTDPARPVAPVRCFEATVTQPPSSLNLIAVTVPAAVFSTTSRLPSLSKTSPRGELSPPASTYDVNPFATLVGFPFPAPAHFCALPNPTSVSTNRIVCPARDVRIFATASIQCCNGK